MITSIEIAYRRGDGPQERATYAVSAVREGEAFDQAVEHLKADLLVKASQEIPSSPFRTAEDHFRSEVYEILRLRPWCVRYGYTSRGVNA